MRPWRLLWCVALVAGCGGGDKSSAGNPNVPGPAAPKESPGGIWHALGTPSDSMTMFIAETGELIVTSPGGFGNGAVIVNNENEIAGTYRFRILQPFSAPTPTGPFPPIQEQTCEIEGTVTERVSLQLDIRCTDGTNNVVERTVGLAYNPAYDIDSSLADIAGVYTLSFSPQTNILTIHNDGTLFGTFQNGATNCTVNGQVEIIDAAFNLYRFELTFSLCQGLLPLFEGATMAGLAANGLPGLPDGAFLLVMFGNVATPFNFFSVLYEPV